jgi:hypothetical protein
MGKRFKGARLVQWGLSRDLVDRFLDFCEAKDGSPAYRQMANALESYMDAADPTIKKRMAKARKKRRSKSYETADSPEID